ncbi:histone H1.2-like [Dromiciops gliroides]|uniref:histone H1.2-like n=1 Tax=Dromiciops gliroides TaxID=33562 RepID=UPI001CC5DCB1|nr:histone H1.2-like [Dromiciops gliroides]
MALKRELGTDQYNFRKHNNRINKEVRSNVSRGALLQVSGRGASSTFRIARTTGTGKKRNSKAGKASTLKKTPGKKTKKKTRVSTSRKLVSSKRQRKYRRQMGPSDKRSGRGNQPVKEQEIRPRL